MLKWQKLISRRRLRKSGSSEEDIPGKRSCFESDVDRIIFSGAFRRLARKTQVHPLAANDHVHSRLTHSLEVARVGFALGRGVGALVKPSLPVGITEDDLGTIVHAACLAHDLGNPPFGHAGEEAIGHWFEVNSKRFFKDLSKAERRDVSRFEGNAQGLRVLTQTENHLFDGGLRLTCATLGAFMKYPWTSASPGKKFGAYLTERSVLAEIAEELGLISKGANKWCRHPLAHLVEAADDICYAIIDLEDAVELRMLRFKDVEELLLSIFGKKERTELIGSYAGVDAFRVNMTRLRGPVFDRMVDAAIEAFELGHDAIMAGEAEGDIFAFLPASDPRRKLIPTAKELARKGVFQDPRKIETELGSYATFESLLEAYCQAAVDVAHHLKSPNNVPLVWKSQRVLALLGDHAPTRSNAPKGASWTEYQCLRRVCDYVGGMTDNYATYIAKQLQGMAFTGLQRP